MDRRAHILMGLRTINAMRAARLSRAVDARDAAARVCTDLVLLQIWSQAEGDRALIAQANALWSAVTHRVAQLRDEEDKP